MSARWRAARAISRSPTMPCRATIPTIRCARSGRPSRRSPLLDRGLDGLRIAVAGGYFKGARAGGGLTPSTALPRRSAPIATIEIPEAERARAAAYVITASEGASLHLAAAAHARARFRSRRCATG